ncbi:MAG: hypothetical protein F6K40_11850 [Okeania sp. SIO3I5]|uniref:hypothetical protein n=1 Tax=Okeania sp. SIO3I5 TaxID=2607805 RepID=UPI0013BDA208|nr:hypothetical protein [Okeania sp. SIO3I5]NEQ36933.1 hypothetical protein [Okeania sp. SIO3I5]
MRLSLIIGISSLITILPFASNLDAANILYPSSKSSSEFTQTNIIYLADNWYNYKAKDGSYTIYFPQKPQEENLSLNTPLGKLNALFVFYQYPEEKRIFYVSHVKYPVEPSQYNVEKGLDGARDGAAQNTNSIIVSEKRISYKGFPGREIIFQSRERPDLKTLARIYIDPNGPILYTLQVIAEDGNLDFPEAKAFLDSFVVLEGVGNIQ